MDDITNKFDKLMIGLGSMLGNGPRSNLPITSSVPVTPQVATVTTATPQIPKINIQSQTPQPSIIPTVQPKFSIDSSNITSDHLATDNTPNNVLAYRNKLQDQYQTYLAQQAPLQQNLVSETQLSPDYMSALNQTLNTNQGYRAGIQNIRSKPIPLEFEQGQEAALTRDTALTQEANAENLGLQQTIRQNNIDALNTGITQNQNNYQDQFAATQAAQNFGLQQGQLDVSQQQAATAQQSANQNRYSYQQITNPNTGFPTIQIIDNQTGLPSGNVDPSSSQGQALISNGAVQGAQPPQQTNGTVGGYDLSSYASAPDNVPIVNSIYNAINTAVGGQITDAGTAQAVISQLSPNSPITGEMVMNTAQKYGIDPSLAISIMQHESQLGTDGSKGAKQNNFGNVGNTDNLMASGGSVSKNNPQAGVDAVGQWLANHQAQGSQQSSTSSPSYSYDQIIQSAPTQLGSAIKPLPDGSAYIDASALANPQFATMAQNFAKQAGIRVLNSSDAATLNTVTQSIKNMQTLASTFGDLAHNTAFGALASNLTDIGSKVIDTNYGSQLKSYQSNREGLFQQIRALAGSSPRLNAQELNTASNSMPTLDAFSKDTLKDGINKLVKTQSYLDNAIKTFIPNYPGTPVLIAGQYSVLGTDGKAYQFPTNDAALNFLKAQ